MHCPITIFQIEKNLDSTGEVWVLTKLKRCWISIGRFTKAQFLLKGIFDTRLDPLFDFADRTRMISVTFNRTHYHVSGIRRWRDNMLGVRFRQWDSNFGLDSNPRLFLPPKRAFLSSRVKLREMRNVRKRR